ncbi:uncharacterized protein LOC130217111 [Danio aesculapii]|uniref:uncharacterized protein LOC130217111 n=1 Tax=Danio aesculapii TaxID=1142201 RepID=UPI0024C0D0E2|nr:uncharacterized protein LOC130217111 [Danio aesculapii]
MRDLLIEATTALKSGSDNTFGDEDIDYSSFTGSVLKLDYRKAAGLAVRGPSAPLSAPLGSSVVLPCYVDKALTLKNLEVQWRRTDSGILVHLYQDGKSRPEAQQQDYYGRANFFTEEIQHGNFSLRLNKLRAQDEGIYRCRVYSQQDTGQTVAQIKYVERLLVSGSNHPVSAYVGDDVTLNCFVDSHITPEHIKVLWMKTDKYGHFLVLFYQNKEIVKGAKPFRGRVRFFTFEILKGNFSLRLRSVRTEDKGVYICQVFAGDLSAKATVELEGRGFSSLHIAVLVLCVAAGSGAVLLLFCLIYCRLKNTVSSSTIWNLQLSLILFPNLCMFIAFILWGFTEGSLHETITCSALYILRPFMLIWALSYVKYLKESLKPWISVFTPTRELAVFTVVVYSVLFSYGGRKRPYDTDITPHVVSGVGFGGVLLMCLILSTGFKNICCRLLIVIFLAVCEMLQLIFSFGFAFLGPLMSPAMVICYMLWLGGMSCIPWLAANCVRRTWILVFWIITTLVVDIIRGIAVYEIILQSETECLEWICVLSFLEALKIVVIFVQANEHLENRKGRQTDMSQQGSNTLSLCNELMYMFGAVGVVLLSSVSLTAELFLKEQNGERVIEDLRVIVFPSESAFAFYCLVLQMLVCYQQTVKVTPLKDINLRAQQNCEMETIRI